MYFEFLQIPKDWVLFAIIVLVVIVDLLIIVTGTAIPSSRLNATSVRDAQHPTATDVSDIIVIIHAYALPNVLYRRSGNFRVKKLSYDKFPCKN